MSMTLKNINNTSKEPRYKSKDKGKSNRSDKNNSSHNISHSDVADELDYVQPYVADEHKQHKLSLCFISKGYCLCTHKYNGNSRTSLPTKQEAATRKR